jgi:hypothetical protein
MFTIWKLDRVPPDFWADKVNGVYVLWIDLCPEYQGWTTIVDLKPDTIKELLNREFRSLSQALFEWIFPHPPEERPKPRHGVTFPSLLYLHDSRTLGSGDKLLEESAQFAIEYRELFGQSNSLSVPHLLFETLFFPALSALYPEDGMTAVSFQALRPNAAELRLRHKAPIRLPDELRIPSVVFDCMRYMAVARVAQHLTDRVQALPIYKKGVSEYMATLFALKAGRPNGRRRRSAIDTYESAFLLEREQALVERLTTLDLRRTLRGLLSNNYIHLMGRARPSVTLYPNAERDRFQSDVLRELTANLRSEFTNSKRAADLLGGREAALSDFLRDRATAEATRANLDLQKAIKRLTVAALLIALMSLGLAAIDFVRHPTPLIPGASERVARQEPPSRSVGETGKQ